jgi:lytic murein transglycosylase
MRMRALKAVFFFSAVFATLGAAPARAADCGDSAAGFNEWLTSFKQVALGNGISQQVIDSSLNGVVFDPSVAAHDRGQNFGSNFAAFSARHVTPARVKRGKTMMLAYAEPLERIEQRYGVPGPVIVAIWGLETDYGAGLGGYSMFSALATLAYDCRRAQIYRAELIDALMLVQRGLLRPSQKGAWAGEIGQTQFMPSAYLKYAVNAHGGGGGDLVSSPADALASTANFLRSKGWSPGAGWDEGQPNFDVLLQWNSAPVYAKTVALFANMLAGKQQ